MVCDTPRSSAPGAEVLQHGVREMRVGSERHGMACIHACMQGQGTLGVDGLHGWIGVQRMGWPPSAALMPAMRPCKAGAATASLQQGTLTSTALLNTRCPPSLEVGPADAQPDLVRCLVGAHYAVRRCEDHLWGRWQRRGRTFSSV